MNIGDPAPPPVKHKSRCFHADLSVRGHTPTASPSTWWGQRRSAHHPGPAQPDPFSPPSAGIIVIERSHDADTEKLEYNAPGPANSPARPEPAMAASVTSQTGMARSLKKSCKWFPLIVKR